MSTPPTMASTTTPIESSSPIDFISTQTLNGVSDADESLLGKIKKYGKVGIITHLAVSWTVLGLAYIVISRTNQTQRIIKFFKLENKIPPKAGSFAIAFLVYKASIPVRFGISMMTIPLVIKALDIKVEDDANSNATVTSPTNQTSTGKEQLKSEGGIATTNPSTQKQAK